ncbi:MAG: NADH-quinone oxidoreductase subunit C [Thermomicrobiales bacterium]
MSVPGNSNPPGSSSERQQLAEAQRIASQSPDASLDSAPVSNVAGLKAALLDDWSREAWFADDIEAHPVLRVLRADFPHAIVDAVRFRNETTIHVAVAHWREICTHLRDHPRLQVNMLSDLTAVDMLRLRERPRFDVVAQLYSIPNRTRLRLKTGVDDGEPVPSLVPIWNGANWLERECYDMFGIIFDGHPNLKRMLLPDDWEEGHPLRKDYPLRGWREFPVYNTERTVGRVRTRWTGRGAS